MVHVYLVDKAISQAIFFNMDHFPKLCNPAPTGPGRASPWHSLWDTLGIDVLAHAEILQTQSDVWLALDLSPSSPR
jgi:hypothetical protein